MTAAAPSTFWWRYEQLASVAQFLCRSRAGSYERLVAAGHLTLADAARDEAARNAIAEDWIAIAAGSELGLRCEARDADKRWALGEALRIADLHVDKRRADGEDDVDHVELRDAIACLLWYEQPAQADWRNWIVRVARCDLGITA